MRETVRHTLRITGGILLMGLGILGLFLPILQGWLFLGMGLLLLFPKDTWLGRKIRAWLKEKRGDLRDRIDRRLGRKKSPREQGEGPDRGRGDEDGREAQPRDGEGDPAGEDGKTPPRDGAGHREDTGGREGDPPATGGGPSSGRRPRPF